MSRQAPARVDLEELDKQFGEELAVRSFSLRVEQGEFVTLLGPSGCGKTTTLRCIAGLERPDGGEIRIAGDIVASARRGLFLDPEERSIGMVFQSYAVWPHMTVFDNVAYGLRVRRTDRTTTRTLTMKALELVGLDAVADRYATRLSGGQRQRVALARAIVYRPRVILFDEPLSNLDAKLREQMRIELVRLQREVGITSIYVTHDQAEALVMSDRVVVMNRGTVQQVADPRTIYARPANAFVARFIGVANLMEARLLGREDGLCDLEVSLGPACAPARLRASGGEGAARGAAVYLCLRPEDIRLHAERPPDRPRDGCVEGEIIDLIYLGSHLECRVRVGCHELCVQAAHDQPLAVGQKVFLAFAPDDALCLAG